MFVPQLFFLDAETLSLGPEHTAAEGNAVQPSFCTLPLFHVPMALHTGNH
ncbi:hypothetical protein BDR03DRAFT_1008074 [Suillus americanus]|nr:hypothetical protein BDR03DRAFT_1008074 [Suillus americanus]